MVADLTEPEQENQQMVCLDVPLLGQGTLAQVELCRSLTGLARGVVEGVRPAPAELLLGLPLVIPRSNLCNA